MTTARPVTRKCVCCKTSIDDRGARADRCAPCQKEHRAKYIRGWHRNQWATNPDYREKKLQKQRDRRGDTR